MSVAANQQRTFLRLAAQLRPHWRRDVALPNRIQSLFAAHREFGSRDRRLYRELIYTTLRHLPWIEPLLDPAPAEATRLLAWLIADIPATRAFRAEFKTGEPPAGDRTDLLPSWFRSHCQELFSDPELETQLRRAPLWLRLQTPDPQPVFAEFAAMGWTCRSLADFPDAVALDGDVDVTRTAAWQNGLFEVQDLGSQLILASVGVAPGGRWLDACAGAGGKTLQLAQLLGPAGHVDAHDIRSEALAELRRRAARTRLPQVRTVTQPAPGGYNGVLVDAPCSGSGTWRRAPHLKWVTDENAIARAAALQAELLRKFAGVVRPGGRLIYATCSLSRRENQDVLTSFLAEHSDFAAETFAATFGFNPAAGGMTLWPSGHDTDGFFVASLRRR